MTLAKSRSLNPSVRLAWTGALTLCLLVAAACRGSGPSAGRSGKTLTVAVVPMGTTHEFWKSVHAGALTAARDLGIRLVWKGPLKETDRNEQVQIVETLTGSGIDALVLSPLDDRALIRPVLEAAAFGIPTVTFNTALAGSGPVALIATDNFRGGVIAAERVGRLTGGRGRLILIRVTEGVEGTRLREEGFLETIRRDSPGLTILSDNQYGGASTETAYQTMENLLARFPAVDALFTPNESTTFGALRALQDHGLAGKVVHIGFDSSAKLIEALGKKEILGLVLQDPFEMGYRSVRTAVAHLRGEPYEKKVATGVVLATPDNMNEPRIRRLLEPDLSVLSKDAR
jgi:ribose transport system substrate-binding protein